MLNFRVAAKSFIVKDNKLLLLKRCSDNVQKPNLWEIPGGRLEPGENPYDGVKRETMEETGLEIDVLHPINVRHFVRADDQTITLIVFLCRTNSDTVQISDEHSAYEWIPMEQCKERLTTFFHEEVDRFHKLEMSKLI
jgi:8-oxo-dGTP diphosphatase